MNEPESGSSAWISLLAGVAVVALLGAVLWPVSTGPHRSSISTACISNIKQCAIGQIMYATDNNDTLPPAGMWMDRISPFVKNTDIFTCPALKGKPNEYGYAMKKGLSEMPAAKISDPDVQVLLFESADLARNANGAFAMPDPPRHGTGGSVAYLDGHAKKLTPAQAASAGKKASAAHP